MWISEGVMYQFIWNIGCLLVQLYVACENIVKDGLQVEEMYIVRIIIT